MKRCKKCGELKPTTEFYKARGTKDGRRGDCKACNLAQQHARYVADAATAKQRVKQWQQENADRVNAYHRERRKDPTVKETAWAGHLRRKYGISTEQYRAMLEGQSGCCAICRGEPKSGQRLHVDHDHRTGQVRGLLCFTCNNALGDFDDDPSRLRAAIRYLTPAVDPGPAFERRLEELRAMRPVWERV